MVLLAIKELASSAEDIIMVTSTVMKDTGGSTEAIYRPNAIRALCRIIDVRSVFLPVLTFLLSLIPHTTGHHRPSDRTCHEDGDCR